MVCIAHGFFLWWAHEAKKTSAATTHYSPVTKAYLIDIIEMLKQKKIMLEEHQKHIMDLWTKKDDVQNENLNIVEGEGNSLTRKKRTKNELEK